MDKTIIANWKANPVALKEARELFKAESDFVSSSGNLKTVICPPFVFLNELSSMLHDMPSMPSIRLGAQDVSSEKAGPHTGETTVDMLKNLGISYVLVGHSERRVLGDTDARINRKIELLLEAGIIPVLLIGEKDKAGGNQEQELTSQLKGALNGIEKERIKDIIFVYEPVWAISTNKGAEVCGPDNIVSAINIMKSIIQKQLGDAVVQDMRFLYGGSVSADNAKELFSRAEIGGAVIGSASLRPEEFTNILRIADASFK